MATNRFLTIVGSVRQLVTAISASAGAADANKVIATDSTGKIALSLMPTGLGPNTTIVNTSEALEAGNLVNVWNNAGTRNVRKADATNARAAHGFVLAAVANGQPATVYLSGENTGLSGLTPGVQLYLAAAGGVSTGAPSTAGQIIQPVGFASSATSAVFEFDEPTLIG